MEVILVNSKIMLPEDSIIAREVEKKLEKAGINISKIDILVFRGEVLITGHLLERVSGREITQAEFERIKTQLLLINGVKEVVYHPVAAGRFI